ncbi:MAG: hypothetical protein Tsb009_32430 [Planctomycetaceae bacterium]
MKTRITVIALFVFAGFSNFAYAGGGLIQTLPKEGAWVKYFIEMKANIQQREQNMSGELTMRFLGTVKENGEPCRWVEMQMVGQEGERKTYHVAKLLIREKDLAPGAKTNLQIIRGWKRDKKDGEVKELSEMEKSANGPTSFFFSRTRKNKKDVKTSKTLDYQKGQLKIPQAVQDRLEIGLGPNAPKDFKYELQRTVWSHKTVPSGTAAMELKIKITRKEMVLQDLTMSFTLQDYGTGAKSALPDNK